MDRLTKRFPDGSAGAMKFDWSFYEDLNPEAEKGFFELLRRLAAYEDTGYEPEQIAKGIYTAQQVEDLQNNAYDLGVDSVLHNHFDIPWPEAADLRKKIDHLRELVKLEAEGKLAKLPCKIGSKVWFLNGSTATVTSFYHCDNINAGNIWVTTEGKKRLNYPVSDFGIRIFLSKEEMEAAIINKEKTNYERPQIYHHKP